METTTTDPDPSRNAKGHLKRSGDPLKIHIAIAMAYAIVMITMWAMIHLYGK